MTLYQPIFVVYIIMIVMLMLTCFILHNRFEAESIDNSIWYLEWKEYHPAVLATLAGIAGSLSVTFSKGMMELLKVIYIYIYIYKLIYI